MGTRLSNARTAGVTPFNSVDDVNWDGLPIYGVTGPETGQIRDHAYPTYTLHLVVRGACSIELSAGRRSYRLDSRRGTFSGYPAGIQWDRCSWNGQVSIVGMQIGTQVMETWAPDLSERWSSRIPETFRCERDEQIESLALAMYQEFRDGSPCGRLYIESLSIAMICRLMTLRVKGPEKVRGASALPEPAKQRVMEFVSCSLDTELSMRTLAALVPCSPNHFAAMFKASFGATVHQYVIRERVKRARLLLERGGKPSVVALECGFSSQSHLTSVFRQIVNCTPGRFQAQMRGKPVLSSSPAPTT